MFIILKEGSTGENVKHLQSFLKLKTDGDFGPRTKTAVEEWQKNLQNKIEYQEKHR